MKPTSVKFFASNAIVIVADAHEFDLPDRLEDSLVTANQSCLVIGCRHAVDGEVSIKVQSEPAPTDQILVFRGLMNFGSRAITVYDVNLTAMLSATFSSSRQMINVYVDDDQEPSAITVLVAN